MIQVVAQIGLTINEPRPIEFPNPAVVLHKADLTETSWKRTYLNRVDVNNQVSPSFLFKEANLSNADFSRAKLRHPVTKEALTMPQAIQSVQSNENKTDLKTALQNLFKDAYHLTNNPPKFIVTSEEQNKNFVEDVLEAVFIELGLCKMVGYCCFAE
jgi:hypothetical protein